LVSEFGYNFMLDDIACYPTTVCHYPAAFMSQPQFQCMEGRKNGKITYAVSLQFAQQGAKLSPIEQNSLLQEMEQQMVEMFVQLSKEEGIAVVEELTITPASPTIDSHGALSIVGKARVVTIF